MSFPNPRVRRKPRICVLTYKALTGLVVAAEPLFTDRAHILVDEYGLEEAVFRGRELEQQGKADVLLSAGYNAALLRSQVNLPVASIEVTGFDLLQAIQQASKLTRKVGLAVYRGSIDELNAVRDLLRVKLVQESYQTPTEARNCVLRLRAQGVEVVVGSSLVVGLAEQMGMRGLLFYNARCIEQALERAVELGENTIRHAARHEQLNAVLSHLHEAILAVDEQHRVTAMNPLMQRILELQAPATLGQRLPDVAPELSLAEFLTERDDTTLDEQVLPLRGGTYLMNRSAIRERGRITGALLTLRETAAIQRADSAIRAQRRSRSASARYSFDTIGGESPALVLARGLARRYARTHSTVLITGETGTGKELFAQAIHNASSRCHGPFVALNCAAFPESLLESELFGYEEGAFTGSRKGGKAGLFEAGHTGTLFLDEIGDMPLSLQTRLLRVLQEREVVRLGSHQPASVDVRVVAATHQSLVKRVAEGAFRSDLYYRLHILHIALPPLRERGDDVRALAERLLSAKLRELGLGCSARRVLQPLVPALLQYPWPGNIRELENLMERFAVFLTEDGAELDTASFLREVPELLEPPLTSGRGETETGAPSTPADEIDTPLADAMRRAKGKRQVAAQLLGVSRTTLWRRLKDARMLEAA